MDRPTAYGIGVTKSLGGANAHAFAQMILIDARTNENLQTVNLRDALTTLPNFDWNGKPAEVSQQQMQMIQATLRNVLSTAVSKALRETLPGQL